jgi:succinylglutamate desuccinylase
MMVDAALAANGSSQPDFFALKMLTYIDSRRNAKRAQRVQTPTAIVLCKADHCPECFDDPRQFVQANLNRLWNLCESRFENVEFFATSVVGSLGYATSEREGYALPIPLHTALRGVLEPFEWIISQL